MIIFRSCNASEPNITCHNTEEFENAEKRDYNGA